MVTPVTSSSTARPMRADAVRNRQKILDAAKVAFAERGAASSLDDVAKAAGVGPGTLYRHFPTREDLLHAVMLEWMDDVRADGDRIATAAGDPVDRIEAWFAALLGHVAVYKGASSAMMTAMNDPSSPMYGSCRALNETNAVVLDAVRSSGVLRDDVDNDEVARLVTGVASVVEQAGLELQQAAPMLAIIRDGIVRSPG